jgi:hypothetical protein
LSAAETADLAVAEVVDPAEIARSIAARSTSVGDSKKPRCG